MAVDVIIDPSSGQIYWNDQAGSGTQTIAISGNATNAINIVGYSNFFSPGGGGLGTQILATFNDSATSTFTPGTNAYDLGSTSLRWNFYGTGGNFTGAISTSSTTASTSSTTGALTVSGGAGIAKTSYFAQDVKIQGSTASTNQTTGALVVTGGVGIGGTLNVGIASTSYSPYNVVASFANSVPTESDGVTVLIQNTTSSTLSNSQLLFVDDKSRQARIRFWNDGDYGIYYNTFEIIAPGEIRYEAGGGTTRSHMFSGGNGVSIFQDTVSTSSTSGALTVSGGAGIAKTSYFGQSVFIQGSTASGSTSTGALTVTGGAGIAKTSYFGQDVKILGSTASTTPTTGALTVTGGVGISGMLNVGSTDGLGTIAAFGQTTQGLGYVNIRNSATGGTTNAVQLTLASDSGTMNLGVYGFGYLSSSPAHQSLSGYISSEFGVMFNSGYANLRFGTYDAFVMDMGTTGLHVRPGTTSTSPATGALRVTGGVGISGAIFGGSTISAADNIEIKSGKELRLNNSGNTFYTGLRAGSSSANVTFTLPIADGTANQVLYTNGSAALGWTSLSSVSAITTLNGLTAATQTFATGTSGTDFNISSTTSTHTFNIPYAASGATGLVTTQAQTLAGSKTFSSQTIISDTTASTTTATGSLLVFGGLGVSGQVNAASLQTSGNAVISGNLTFNGVGVFGNATSDTINSLARYISDILPSADNSYDLGNNALGWRNFRISGVGTIATLAVTSATASTTSTTGALIVSGGAGIAKTSYFGQDVKILGSTASTNPTTGALVVNGGVGISGRLSVGLAVTQTVDGGGGAEVIATFASSASFLGAAVVIHTTNSFGTPVLVFKDYSGKEAYIKYWDDSAGIVPNYLEITSPGALYYLAGNSGSGYTGFHIFGGSGVTLYHDTASTSSTTGGLTVSGGAGIAKTSYFGQSVVIQGSTASGSTTTGALVVTGGVGIGGSLNVFGTIDVANNIEVLSQKEVRFFNSANTFYTGLRAGSSSANVTFTLPIADGSANQVLYTNGSAALGWTSNISGTASIATSSINSATTTDTSSTLYLLGSRSSTGFAGTAIYVDSSISILGSQVTAGVWGGTAISAVNGGTGQNTYAIGDILYASSSTALTRLAAGTAGSVLKSNGAGTAPSWQVDSTGSGGAGTVAAPTAASLVAYYPGTGASVASYNRVSINTAAASMELLAQGSLPALLVNATNGASSDSVQFKSSFGDVYWALGPNTQSLKSTNGGILDIDASGAIIVTAPAAVSFYNTAETFYTALTGATNATSNLTFILPTAAGTAGSVLTTAGASGQLYWSAPGSGGGGSGTVTSGTAGSIAYYTGTGTTVGGSPGFTYTTSGTASTINVFGGGAIGTTIFTVQATSSTSVRVGIGTNLPQYELEIVGELSATNKSFVIDHPTKPGKKLRYGSLEGPENGVYVRGELKGSNIIETPDHWIGLVYPDSFTVTLTPISRFSHLYVEKIEDYKVFIADDCMNPIHCYYTVWAERKDIPKLITEY